jgi:hypothetical protein
MKKILFVLVLLGTSTSVATFQSCSATSAVLSNNNVNAVAKSLLRVLTTKLGISSAQSGLVSQLLTSFLTSKSNVLGLAKTDPTAYASQFGGIQNTLLSGLKGVLDAKQMTNLMNLKPSTNDAKNVLSNLFY